jgi:valyl-tRNA synthetase
MSLAVEYPVNSMLELEIEGASSASPSIRITGLVYCTDDVSNTVVLQKSLAHTTLASEIHVLNAASIKSKKVIADHTEIVLELPKNVNQKQLEDKEKKAIKQAEEALKHINQKVSQRAVIVFIAVRPYPSPTHCKFS